MDISAVIEQLKNDGLSPRELSNIKVRLAAEYAYLSGQLQTVFTLKAERWEKFREQCTSDTQAERKWEKTESGLAEMRLKLTMKSIEKLLSAISAKLNVLDQEARMNY